MSIKRNCIFIILAGLMLALCGCGKPNIIGTDAAVYSGGTLYAVAGNDLNSVYVATVAALQQLEIEVTETAKDVFYAKVVGKVADGKTISIRMKPGTDNVTEIKIRASKLGDEERSLIIYEKIKQNLKTGSNK